MKTLTCSQAYAIATWLACSSKQATLERIAQSQIYLGLTDSSEASRLVERIDRYYHKRDGFIPREVLAILKGYK
jgi:predicted metal-binding protein